jgi:hypothetical protein
MEQEQITIIDSSIKTGIVWIDSIINWGIVHPYITSFTIGILLAIILTEIVKAICRALLPELMTFPKTRRVMHICIAIICHWVAVGRIYHVVAQGPFPIDVIAFSPIVGIGFVWIVTRYIEYKTINSGPKSFWARVFIKLKPHRMVKGNNGELERAIAQIDRKFGETTQFTVGDDSTLILKDRKKK